MAQYKYAPLKANTGEFRLVTLLPGGWDHDIRCTLQTDDLDAKPIYDALSYTWGDLTDTTTIWLDGITFQVTRNLAVALRYRRLEDQPQTFWIDAICINQSDLAERSAQVTRMYSIYATATRVIAWTGEADECSDAALDLTGELAHLFEIHDGGPFTPEHDEQLGSNITAKNWSALWRFWERPYWSRVWVLQELAASGCTDLDKEDRCLVLCGRRNISGHAFIASQAMAIYIGLAEGRFINLDSSQIFVEPFITRLLRGNSPAEHMSIALSTCSGIHRTFSIMDMIRTTDRLKATDQRDKLYAILGLLGKDLDLVSPDYTKSYSQIQMNFVKAAVERHRDLDTITHNCIDNFTLHPSWIPEGHLLNTDGLCWQVSRGLYDASAGYVADVKFNIEEGLVSIKGLKVGEVGFVVGPMSISGPAGLESEDALDDWYRDTVLEKQELWWVFKEFEGTLSEDQKEILRRTMVMDVDFRDLSNIATPAPSDLGLRFNAYLSMLNHANGTTDNNFDEWLPSEFLPELSFTQRFACYMEDFVQSGAQAQQNRCFFCTDDGSLMGIGPRCTRQGDILALLYGGSHLFVLRRQGEQYILVGNAYAHGCMHGELLGEAGKACVEQVFTLC